MHTLRAPLRTSALLGGALLLALLARAGADEDDPTPGEAALRVATARINRLEEKVARLEALHVRQAEAAQAWAREAWLGSAQVRGPEAGRVLESGKELILRPQPLSRLLYERWRNDLPHLRELAALAKGRFVAGEGGIGFQVDEVQPGSPLLTLAGIQPGDRLLSVNGLPFSASEREQTNMWERLRAERRWVLRLLRDGQVVVTTFYLED